MMQIMTNRKFLTVAASLLVLGSLNLKAQNDEYKHNWFVGGGPAATTFFSINGDNGFDSKVKAAGEINFGKWYTPNFGVRFGVMGGQYSTNGTSKGMDHLDALYGHGDLMWSVTKGVTPYVHAGILSGMIRPRNQMQNEVAAGFGSIFNWNLTDRFGLYADARFTLMPERVANVKGSRFTGIITTSGGVRYSFENGGEYTGKFTGNFFEPTSTRLADTIFDDMFVYGGGGINTINSFNGYGFSGRITPAAEVGVVKWLTNTFGVRGGIQGLTFSHWGKDAPKSTFIEHGTYHGKELDKEKFGFTYLNLSLIWDLNSIVNGYRSDRPWTLIPYLHGGYINNFSVNGSGVGLTNNEWTAGPGLLNQFRVDDEMSVYIDARAFAINHVLTGNKNDHYTMAGSITAGVAYDLGRQNVRYHGAGNFIPRRERAGANTNVSEGGNISTQPSRWDSYSRELRRAERTGEYAKNWFMGVGAGVNTMFSLGSGNGFDTHVEPLAELFFGKWYTPHVGVRFGVQGGSWAPKSGESSVKRLDGVFAHGDVLYSVNNWFTPYVHAGIFSTMIRPRNQMQNEVVTGFGGIFSHNVTDNLSLYADIRSYLMPGRVADVPNTHFSSNLATSVGLKYGFQNGGTYYGGFNGNFVKPGSTELTDDFYSDWFVQFGGGVNTLQSFNGYGFSGRITPSAQIELGKWLTNTFALRGGVQGLTFSHWGKNAPAYTIMEHGKYKGLELDKEKFGFSYEHLDMMWDATNIFGGYVPDRFWSVIPYLHGGIMHNISINGSKEGLVRNEWAAGAGLLNLFRIDDRASIYVDARAFALNHAVTGNKNDKYTMAGSLNAGVYYDLGRQIVRFHPGETIIPRDKSKLVNGHHDGPYIYNGIGDNWFVGAQAGLSSAVTFATEAGFNGKVTPTVDLFAGKWFSPEYGFRAGVQGTSFSYYGNTPDGHVAAVEAEFDGKKMYDITSNYGYIHGDLLWNALNTFKGYKEERAVEFIPYATAGAILSFEPESINRYQTNFAAGAGAVVSVALNDILKFNTDVRALTFKSRTIGDLEGGYALGLSGAMGFTFDLGKNYWGPGEGILLNSFFDNWFIQSAGGIQSAKYSMEDIIWNGRITPSEELMIGKWFSPSVGLRAGVQGTSIMNYGESAFNDVYYGDGRYAGKNLTYEKFYTKYNHADIMWNVLNTFNYNEDRKFDVIPYAHFGIYKTRTANRMEMDKLSDEFATGLGLMLSHDIDRNVSIYADARGTAMKKYMFGDENANHAGGFSASIGLTYNLDAVKNSSYDVNGWRHLPEEEFDAERDGRRWGVSVNLIDLADYGTLNIGVQRAVSRHFTTDMQGKLNLWSFNQKTKFDQKQTLSLGTRYWPWYTYSGIWFKGFAQVEEYSTSNLKNYYTIGRGSNPEKGAAYGAGLGLGYSLMLRRNINLDFGVTGWAGMSDSFGFSDYKFTAPVSHDKKFFVAPSDVHFSVMFIF